jgi:hypothetical protein
MVDTTIFDDAFCLMPTVSCRPLPSFPCPKPFSTGSAAICASRTTPHFTTPQMPPDRSSPSMSSVIGKTPTAGPAQTASLPLRQSRIAREEPPNPRQPSHRSLRPRRRRTRTSHQRNPGHAVYFNRDYDPYGRAMEQKVHGRLRPARHRMPLASKTASYTNRTKSSPAAGSPTASIPLTQRTGSASKSRPLGASPHWAPKADDKISSLPPPTLAHWQLPAPTAQILRLANVPRATA